MLLFLIILALVGCQEIFGAPIAETESLDLDRILSLDHKANLRQRYLPPFLGKKQLSAWEQLVAQEREPSTKETEGTQGNEEKRGLNVKLPENVASLPPFFQDRDLRPYSFGFNYGVNKGTKKKERKKEEEKKLWKKHVYDQDREYRTGFNYGVNKGTKGNDGTDGTNGTEEKKGLWKKPVYGQDREYRTGFNYGVNKGTKGNDGTDGTNGTEEKKGLWKKPVYGQDRKYRTGFNYGGNKGTKRTDGNDGTDGTERNPMGYGPWQKRSRNDQDLEVDLRHDD